MLDGVRGMRAPPVSFLLLPVLVGCAACAGPTAEDTDAGVEEVCPGDVDVVVPMLDTSSTAVDSLRVDILAGDKYGPHVDWIVTHLRAINEQGEDVPLAYEYRPSTGYAREVQYTFPADVTGWHWLILPDDPCVGRRPRQLRACEWRNYVRYLVRRAFHASCGSLESGGTGRRRQGSL